MQKDPNDSSSNKASQISKVFTDLNRKFEEQQTWREAQKMGMPYFDLTGFPIDGATLSAIPYEEAHMAGIIPFFKEGPYIKLGVSDVRNSNLHRLLAELNKKKNKVETYLVSKSALEEAWQQYKKIIPVHETSRHEMAIGTDAGNLEKLKNLPGSEEEVSAISASELLNLMIGAAQTINASDIHLEPEKKVVKIRFRVDGVLQDIVGLPISLQHSIISRIKLLAGLKLNVVNTPQDGRFSVNSESRRLDLRVSSLPSANGESIVMRLLGLQGVELEVEKLGLSAQAIAVIHQALAKPNGMILTTGPTGSGKTTTLYSFLNELNKPGVKIITLEDPVEYKLGGIIQTPIDRSAGMDFAKGLRSILRQDPDIVMVGEIRDFETAESASQAALTGHLVLSTLHSNDSAGAIPRLLDLGVKPVTLAPALSALMAQRLLRRICQNCRQAYKPTREELLRVKTILSNIPKNAKVEIPAHMTFSHSTGCKECHNLGYKGRVGVFEVFEATEAIQELVFKQASTHEIKKQAVIQGMLSMQQDGILKALKGMTDLAEVWRVTEE